MAWTEIVNKRDRNEKHYYDSDTGKYQAVITIHDQHYHDGLSWQDVDENIADDNGGFDKKCDKTRHIFRVGTGGNYRWQPRRNVITEYVDITQIQYWRTSGGGSWRTLNLPAAVWKNQGASWDMANLYAEINNTWRRVETTFILKDATTPTKLRFAISLVGLTYNHITGELTSISDGLVWGSIDNPLAWYGNEVQQLGISIPVTTVYDGSYIEWSVDTTGAAFPIYIDPTFTDGYGGDVTTYKDTYTKQDAADTVEGAVNILEMNASTSYRCFPLLFFTLSSLSGKTITSSTLYLNETGYGAGAYTTYVRRIKSVNDGWTEAGSTWNHKIATSDHWGGDTGSDGGTDAGCSVSGTDYESTSMATFAGNGDNAFGYAYTIALDTTETTSMIAANYGMIITSATSSNQSVMSSDHATTGYRPKLVIVYTDAIDLVVSDCYSTSQVDTTAVAFSPRVRVTWIQLELPPAPSATILVVADAYSTSQTDAVALTQIHNLTVPDTYSTSQADAVVTTKNTSLVVNDAYSTSQTDAVTTTKNTSLIVLDTYSTSQSDSILLTQVHNLVVPDSYSTSQVDTVVVTSGAVNLVVQDAYSTSQTDAVTTTKETSLVITDAYSTSQADAPILTQVHILTVQDAYSTSQVDIPVVTIPIPLFVYDAFSTSQVDAVTISTGGFSLVVQDAYSTSQVDAVTTTKESTLSVADAYSTSQSDAVSTTKESSLVVADAYSTSQTDTFKLTQAHNLVVNDAYSTSQVDTVTVTSIFYNLAVQDAYSVTQVDTVTLTSSTTLSVSDAYSVSQVDHIYWVPPVTKWVELSLWDRDRILILDERDLDLVLNERDRIFNMDERDRELTLIERSRQLTLEDK